MIEITTDTATICIFDKECLEHRKDDVGDWWSLPKNELQEVINGNALFLNVDNDGTYLVNVMESNFNDGTEYNFVVKSGRLFIGPGEEVSGGGFEPDGSWGGEFIDLTPGNYKCQVRRKDFVIDLFLSLGGNGRNSVSDLIRV